ncbi:MAG: protoheme IX farnesyltransferase [Betaproteobacteria bacterium]
MNTHTNPCTSAVTRGPMRTMQLVLGLCKLRIGVMIMITALVGLLVTPGPTPAAIQVVVTALSVLLASASAGAFNQYFEHESDRLMARTRTRAFVTGELPHTAVWLLPIGALLLLAVAIAWWLVNGMTALFVFLGAFFYGVVYTVWLKQRSAMNIVIGGLAGSFAVLAGSAAVDPAVDPFPGALPLTLAAVLFLWTPPHFWSLAIANRDEYAAAGVPMLPVVVGDARAAHIVFASTAALVAVSLLPAMLGAGLIYLGGALLGGAYFLYKSWLLARSPDRGTAMGSFFASLVQLSLLLAGASIDSWIS